MIERVEDFTARRRWAVVGASRDPNKYGHRVYASLLRAGYEVYGVNPNADQILGRPVYPTLAHLPVKPEVVSMVVPPAEAEPVLRQCADLGLTRVWLQPGAESAEAVRFCRENGIEVVWDVCVIGYRRRWHESPGPELQP
ncbi:MAG: CoA-binding protein [Anaerolineae bacterium]|nr:CoA-binding protein [Anaerolineae bacterium]